MHSNEFFLLRQNNQKNTIKTARAKLRLGVITDNQYLLTGIISIVDNVNRPNKTIDVISVPPQQWLLTPENFDFIITDHRFKNALLLLPVKYCPTGSFSGSDILPYALFGVLHMLVRYGSVPIRWFPVLRKPLFSVRERELLSLLSAGMSTKNMIENGWFTAKEISHYKITIKRKADCRRDVELLSALMLARQICFTSDELSIFGEFFSMSKLYMNNSSQIIRRKYTQ